MPTSAVQTTTTAAGALEYKYTKFFRDAVHRSTRFVDMMRKGLPNGGRFEMMEEEKLRSARAIWKIRHQFDEGNSAHSEGGAFGTRSSPAWTQMYENLAYFNFGVNISNVALEVAKSNGAAAIQADKEGLIRDSVKSYLTEFNRRALGSNDGLVGIVGAASGTAITLTDTLHSGGTRGSTYYDPMTGRAILQQPDQFIRVGMSLQFLDPAYLGDDSSVDIRDNTAYTVSAVSGTTLTLSASVTEVAALDIIVKNGFCSETGPVYRTFPGLAALVNTDGATTTGATGVVETLRWSEMHNSGDTSSIAYSPLWFQSYMRFLDGAVLTKADVLRTLRALSLRGAKPTVAITSGAVMIKYDETQVQPMVRINKGAAGTVPYKFKDGMDGLAFQFGNVTIPVVEDDRTREAEMFIVNPNDFLLMELGGGPHFVTGTAGQPLEQDQDYDLKIAQGVHYVGMACVDRGRQGRITGIDVSE